MGVSGSREICEDTSWGTGAWGGGDTCTDFLGTKARVLERDYRRWSSIRVGGGWPGGRGVWLDTKIVEIDVSSD